MQGKPARRGVESPKRANTKLAPGARSQRKARRAAAGRITARATARLDLLWLLIGVIAIFFVSIWIET